MAWTPTAAGQTLTSAKLEELASYAVAVQAAKGADTSRNTTATVSADPDLVIVLPANCTYMVEAALIVTSAANAAGDFRTCMSWTNTASVYTAALGLSAAGLASGTIADLEGVAQTVDATSPTSELSYGASTTPTTVMRWFRVVTGGSAVTLSLQWAQQASNGSNTTLCAGSSMTARRVD